jgi:hypothetical protein
MTTRTPLVLHRPGTYRRGAVIVTGTILIGASGAVTSFVCEAVDSSSGVVKTAAKTGRYTVTLLRKYRNPRVTNLSLIGPTDAALTSTDGWFLSVRNLTGQTFDIQASQVSLADANPTSGNSIHFSVEVQVL